MSSKRKVLLAPRPGVTPRTPRSKTPTEAPIETPDDAQDVEELDDDLPRANRRSGGGGFGPAIAGIMHGIDADIFRDPAAIQRMQRDRAGVVRTADGTVIGIDLPGEGVIDDPEPDAEAASGAEERPAGEEKPAG